MTDICAGNRFPYKGPVTRKVYPCHNMMLAYCQLEVWGQLSIIFELKFYIFFQKMHLKMSSAKWQPLCLGLDAHGACFIELLLLLRFEHFWRHKYTSALYIIHLIFNCWNYLSMKTTTSLFQYDCTHNTLTQKNATMNTLMTTWTSEGQFYLWRAITLLVMI